MATKGTNAKIKELKSSKPEKVSPEDLTKLQSSVGQMNQTYLELGRLSTAMHTSQHALAELQNKMVAFKDEINKTYGTHDINIQDGTINYEEDVKTNKED
tara:strand:+ start:566 stop:865 length:300 start_codon:yes stop_codon:yes gene_type:complete